MKAQFGFSPLHLSASYVGKNLVEITYDDSIIFVVETIFTKNFTGGVEDIYTRVETFCGLSYQDLLPYLYAYVRYARALNFRLIYTNRGDLLPQGFDLDKEVKSWRP